MITVLETKYCCIEEIIAFSVRGSKAEVGSSKIIIEGFLRNILAKLILCLCPPDKIFPSSDITVSYPLGSLIISSLTLAKIQALIISSKVASSLAYLKLSITLPSII